MARKASVERAAAKVGGFATAKKNITIQYQGQDHPEKAILDAVKSDALSHGISDSDIGQVDIYIKPEDRSVYYVINEEINGRIDF